MSTTSTWILLFPFFLEEELVLDFLPLSRLVRLLLLLAFGNEGFKSFTIILEGSICFFMSRYYRNFLEVVTQYFGQRNDVHICLRIVWQVKYTVLCKACGSDQQFIWLTASWIWLSRACYTSPVPVLFVDPVVVVRPVKTEWLSEQKRMDAR